MTLLKFISIMQETFKGVHTENEESIDTFGFFSLCLRESNTGIISLPLGFIRTDTGVYPSIKF